MRRIRTAAMYALWGLLLATYLAAVYALVVVVGGAVAGTGGEPSTALTIAATAVAAATFGWVRPRARHLASRLLLGQRATPMEVLGQFSRRIAGAYATDEVLPGVAQVLVDGTGAARAEVWLVVGQSLRRVASAEPGKAGPADEVEVAIPDDGPLELAGADLVVPVRHQSELLGAFALTSGTHPFTAPEEALVVDLASQAALVLRNLRLQAELAARRDELTAQTQELKRSRRRIVAEQTDERRRLEQNIHDGAQQHLVALLVRIGLAADLAQTDPDAARDELAELCDLAGDALATLDELARGLHPKELREGGLTAALSARAAEAPAGLSVAVEAVDVDRYATEVEAAVYFACLEAVQNASKYAEAGEAWVRLTVVEGHLRFAVADDGRGFDPDLVTPGSGLTNLADRVAALGGTLEITSQPGLGTTVAGTVPLTPGTLAD